MTLAIQLDASDLHKLIGAKSDVDRQAGQRRISLVVRDCGTLRELVARWMGPRVRAQRWARGTKKRYESAIALLERVDTGAGPVLDLAVDDIDVGTAQRVYDMVALGLEGEPSVANARLVQKMLRAAWNDAVRRDEAPPSNPWRLISVHARPRRDLYFAKGFVPKLIAGLVGAKSRQELPRQVANFLIIEATIGARPWCELLVLQRRDVDLDRGVMHFRADEAPGTGEKRGKGDRSRAVDLDLLQGHARAALDEQLELGDMWVWPATRKAGHHMHQNRVLNRWWPRVREQLDEAGLSMRTSTGAMVPLYAMRHAVATHLILEQGRPIAQVARILGHSPGVLEEHYLQQMSMAEPSRAAGREIAREVAVQVDGGDGGGGSEIYGARRERIRSARKKSGLTQAELARVLSDDLGRPIGKTAVGGWERGQNPIPMDAADRLTRLAGLSLDFLAGRADR